ncbi:MAG: hypothetical protein K5651_01785, partial [Bacteroidales bacterium]|nr:hypothetical protein [Bacteroidales bacterium]
MEQDRFLEWRNTATPEEICLSEKVMELGELFEDMLFQPETHSGELLKVKAQDRSSDESADDRMELPDPLEYFCYTYFRFKVFQPEAREDKDTIGYFDGKDQVLCVRADKLLSWSHIISLIRGRVGDGGMVEGHPPDRRWVLAPAFQMFHRAGGDFLCRPRNVHLGGRRLHVPVDVFLRIEFRRVA